MNGEEMTNPQQPLGGEAPMPPSAQLDTAQFVASAAVAAEPSREEVRRQLVQQVEQWIDRMLEGEPPPAGLPEDVLAGVRPLARGEIGADRDCDLYALFSALTTLSGEIRLQGRAFKQVADALAPLAEVPPRLAQVESAQRESIQQLAQLAEQEAEAEDTAMPSGKDMLSVLVDMYDRLERGLRTFDASVESIRSRPLSWLGRLTGSAARIEQELAAAQAMREGYRLTLSRLEAAMQDWGVQRLGAPGEMFEPEVMTVVDVQESDEPDGTVLEVYRSGYALHGRVLATAQVKVAKGNGRQSV